MIVHKQRYIYVNCRVHACYKLDKECTSKLFNKLKVRSGLINNKPKPVSSLDLFHQSAPLYEVLSCGVTGLIRALARTPLTPGEGVTWCGKKKRPYTYFHSIVAFKFFITTIKSQVAQCSKAIVGGHHNSTFVLGNILTIIDA